MTTTPDKREEFARRIRARIDHDKFWGAANFAFAHCLAWVAVLSSFGSAIAAASKAAAIFTASFAAIPGCVILLARSLNFMPLSRWHYKLASRLEAVERSMEFENRTVEEVSAEFSTVMLQFDDNSPEIEISGLLETPTKLKRTSTKPRK